MAKYTAKEKMKLLTSRPTQVALFNADSVAHIIGISIVHSKTDLISLYGML